MQLTALSLFAIISVHPELIGDYDFEALKVPQPITGALETSSVASSQHESIRLWWLSKKNWSEGELRIQSHSDLLLFYHLVFILAVWVPNTLIICKK